MKISISVASAAVLSVITLFAGCKKNNELEQNSIIIAGNSNASYNRVIVPDDCFVFPEDDLVCNPVIYKNDFLLRFATGERMYIQINKATSSSEVPVGSFPFAGQCQIGNACYFYFQDGKKSAALYLSAGTITINEDDSIYDIDIDLTIDDATGGGTVTGNYHGLIQPGDAR